MLKEGRHLVNERILKRRLSPEEVIDWDRVYTKCSLFTGVSDIENKSRIKRKDRKFNALVLTFLYSNLIRTTIECFIPDGSQWFIYLGDFKIWWGKPYIAHQIVFFMAVLIVPIVLSLNLMAGKELRRWCLPFKFMQGLISAQEAKLWSVDAVVRLKRKMRMNYKRAFVATLSVLLSYGLSVLVSYVIFYDTWTKVILLGIPWTVYEVTWSFYITSNMNGLLPNSFDIVCYYLRLRYDQIDKLLKQLNINHRNLSSNPALLPVIRRQFGKIIYHLNDTNKDLIEYNKFWSKYTFIVLLSYIPQLLFEFYVFIFLPMNTSVLMFSLLLNLNIFALITQLTLFSAILHKKVWKKKIQNN